MKHFKIRPDKVILSGLKTLTHFSLNMYSEEKSEAKGRGEITFIGEKKIEKVQTQLYKYNKEKFEKEDNIENFDFLNSSDISKVYWLNFHGLHEVDRVQNLGKAMTLDRITVRQILDTTLRPKVDEYEHYLFFSIKSILKDDTGALDVEQLSFLLTKNCVVSFQEKIGDHFGYIRNKIEEKLGPVRVNGPDFLLYQLLDAIIDNYFETIESINFDIKELEELILSSPTQELLVKLERLKRVAEMIKKSLNPFKDAIRIIQNRKSDFISDKNTKYFLDLTNSCLSAIEEIDSVSKSLEGLTNIYFSSLTHKMNEIMKVLSTVATIFIPLTFVAGIYGMNFENMPELHYKYGYFVVWGIMGLIFIGMLIYFKKKKWL